MFQEGPENISVFNIPNRSTGAVEAYNGVLGREIPAHAHFFRFVLGLRNQEWQKAKTVKSLVQSGGATGRDRRGKSKVSTIFIFQSLFLVGFDKLFYDFFFF